MKKGFWFCRLQPILEIALVKLAVSKWSGKLYSVLFPQTTKTKKNLKSRDEPKWSSSSSQSIFLEVCSLVYGYIPYSSFSWYSHLLEKGSKKYESFTQFLCVFPNDSLNENEMRLNFTTITTMSTATPVCKYYRIGVR